jgi:hypothetical protein
MADSKNLQKKMTASLKKNWLLYLGILLAVLYILYRLIWNLLLYLGILLAVIHFIIPMPPDFSKSNRIIIQYPNSAYKYFNYSHTLNESVLSQEEKEYVKSLGNTLEITKVEIIMNFSRAVSLARFKKIFGYLHLVSTHYDCYENDKHISSFYISNGDIITKYGIQFKNPFKNTNGLEDTILPDELKPFQLRSSCAESLLFLYKDALKQESSINYLDPNRWCGLVLVTQKNYAWMKNVNFLTWLDCPAVNEGKSNYAMNPNCEPNSPADMVLLFETKAGWNQNGGSELFTFDNHDPKGGCVLLNDGTVKFIRTKEELNALRWK